MRRLVHCSIGALAVVAVGCFSDDGGEGDGGSGNGGNGSGLDSGSHDVSGTCSDIEEPNQIAIASVSGQVSASISWNDGGDDDIDLYIVETSTDSVLDLDENAPPGDSPAQVNAVVDEDMDVAIYVVCYSGTNVDWDGTVDVP